MSQVWQYASLAWAHGETFRKKLFTGSKPAVRIPAVDPLVPSPQSSTWWNSLVTAVTRCKDTVVAYCQNPTLVLEAPNFPTVFIGSGFNAATKTQYETLGIDCVLSCAAGLPAFCKDQLKFYQHLDMVDDANGYVDFVNDHGFRLAMYKFIQLLHDDAAARRTQGKPMRKLLVHCVFGRSRSVALTIFLLFLWNQHEETPKSMAQLYKELHDLRPVIFLNVEFYTGLTEFEREYQTNPQFRQTWMSAFSPVTVQLN